MVDDSTLEQKLSKAFTEKVLDEKYAFIYASIRRDFISFGKEYSKLLNNYEADDSENDSSYYFSSQMRSFGSRLRDFFENTGLDVELFFKESGFSAIRDVAMIDDINHKVTLGVSVDYFDEGRVYFEFELKPKEVVLNEMRGSVEYYSTVYKELKE